MTGALIALWLLFTTSAVYSQIPKGAPNLACVSYDVETPFRATCEPCEEEKWFGKCIAIT